MIIIGHQINFMNKEIDYNILLINKISKIILSLNSSYSKPIKNINNTTIGKHVRHIIDFYLCFINGIKKNIIINYDKRLRNENIETDINQANSELNEIITFFKTNQHTNKILEIKLNFSLSKKIYKSSYEHELIHLADHTTHHGYIIQIIINTQFPKLSTNIQFFSPSTLKM